MSEQPNAGLTEADVYRAIRLAREYQGRGRQMLKAVEALLRQNPAEAVPWLERAFESAPGIEPRL